MDAMIYFMRVTLASSCKLKIIFQTLPLLLESQMMNLQINWKGLQERVNNNLFILT